MTKTLVVHDTTTNTLEALDPGKATAIGIPAFQIGNSLPAAGQVVGEGFLVGPTKTGYLWDGTRWIAIVPSALLNYPNDAAVLADKAQNPGSYATSSSTGNLFISAAGGVWHQVGVRSYPTEAGMRADLNALEGDLAWSQDTNQVWYFNTGKWWAVGVHYYPDEHTLLGDGANNAGGAIASAQDTGLIFCMSQATGQWTPMSIAQFPDEPTMRLKITDNLVGQIAIASNKIFVWSGTAWVGDPISYYALEANLWTYDAPLGVLAVTGDTQTAYIKIAAGAGVANWKRLAGPNLTVGVNAPTLNVATGDLFFNVTTNELSVRGATAWNPIGGGCKVAATAPTAPNAGAMWYDTTAKELKTWTGRDWLSPYSELQRMSDGYLKLIGTAHAQLELMSQGSDLNTGVRTRTAAGPEFWSQQPSGAASNYMEVAGDGSVSFPHGVRGLYPKLAAKKAISHHMYNSSSWETSDVTITGIERYVPVGNLYKIEADLRLQVYHGGNGYIRTKWLGVNPSGELRSTISTESTSNTGVTRTLTGVSAAGNIQLEIISWGDAGNADRQVFGNVLVWDLGPAGNIPDFT